MLYSRCSQYSWRIIRIGAAPRWRGRNAQLYDRHLDQPDHQRMSVARGSWRYLAYLPSDAQQLSDAEGDLLQRALLDDVRRLRGAQRALHDRVQSLRL